MQIFIGIVVGMLIGVLIGIIYMTLTVTFSYSDAYMDGANAFKDFVISRLTKMQGHTENVTCEQLIEEINKVYEG